MNKSGRKSGIIDSHFCIRAVYQTLTDFLVKTSGQKQGADKCVKTLMLMHGWGMNSQVWEPIREVLESNYHIIWIDLPGHGFNRHIQAKSLDNMVELIAKYTPKNVHIMGWSLGGMVTQALAQKIPEKIESMTLVASTPRFSQTQNDDWQHAMSDDVLDRFADNLKQNTEQTLKGFIALQFIGVKNAKSTQDALIEQILNSEKNTKKEGGVFINASESENNVKTLPTREALDVGLAILKNDDLRSLKPSCREHWIFAEYDRLIPKEVINDLVSLRPEAHITLLEKAGHAPFITHSELFLNHAIDFIES